MSQPKKPTLFPKVLKALEGANFELEAGNKCWHLKIDGGLVAKLPYGNRARDGGHHVENLAAKVRRYRKVKS